MSNNTLLTAPVIDYLPHKFGCNEGVPTCLEGATIVKIGTFKDCELVEGGGLVIDFRPPGEQSVRRLVLAFTEVEMWVELDPLQMKKSPPASPA